MHTVVRPPFSILLAVAFIAISSRSAHAQCLQWSPRFGANGCDDIVSAMTVFDPGTGTSLYAGGHFTHAGGTPANHIARWNGASWSALGSGTNDIVFAVAAFDDGTGPAIYAAGAFTSAGGVSANHVAKWNGTAWSALGSGEDNLVFALAMFDDGTGPALFAGGQFVMAGGAPASRVAKWNGSVWSPVGSGVSGGVTPFVETLQIFDDGSGPALFAGGDFSTAGSITANSIAKWNGSTWSPLGPGVDDQVLALSVFDEGSGPKLFAGGRFTFAGGVSVQHVARWNGSAWSALRGGVTTGGQVTAFAAFNDGTGPALYVAGAFSAAGGRDRAFDRQVGRH
jgi:hypothetical protein